MKKYQPLHSEEYLRNHWDEFLEKPKPYDEHYINMEAEFQDAMKVYYSINLSEDAMYVVTKIEAKKIADKSEKKIREHMKMIKDIMSGKVTLGYRTYGQDISNLRKLRERFEFNCLQLKDFRKKYEV